jgi:hypothetical protein
MNVNLPVVAGIISTIMFCTSTLPMLKKAFHTKDLHSYSLGNLLLANGGNIVHCAYVFSLPLGPIWFLHAFHTTTTGLMLGWYVIYEWRLAFARRIGVHGFGSGSSPVAVATDPSLQPGGQAQ